MAKKKKGLERGLFLVDTNLDTDSMREASL